MSIGSWIVAAVRLVLIGCAFIVAYAEWSLCAGTDVLSSGCLLVIGVAFEFVVGIGLVALVVYGSRYGGDEAREAAQNEDERTKR